MPDGNRQVASRQRAYSLLTIKSVDNEQRMITGIASTPTPDRMSDIVEPKGAEFKLPLPLLWQHDSGQPIGHVTAAKVTDAGIEVVAQIARGVAPFIEDAWALIKSGLVRGLSIGFSPKEYAFLKDGGVHFTKWDWYELSAVTVPANAEASIQTIKSIASQQRAASGIAQRPPVQLANAPGASGTQSPKGTEMKSITEQIAAFEAKRAANVARRDELQGKAIEAGRSKDIAEKEEFDNLTAEIETIDSELKDLRVMEKQALATATAVPAAAGESPRAAASSRGPIITGMKANIEPGVRFARAAMALLQAKGNRADAANIFRANKRWMDQTPEVEVYLKTAVPAGDTTTSGWASELAYAQDMASEFVDYLRPLTILGKMNPRRVPFNIRYGTQTATSTGNWVGQGQPVPVSKPTVSSGSLGIAKASAIVAIDEELARLSSPSAELLVRDDMARTLATFLDVQFVDPNVAASANVSPASITNGVTATAATGTAAANLRTDLATMLTSMARNEIDISQAVWIMPPETALNISLLLSSLGTPLYPGIDMSGGTLLGRPVITSNSANIPGSPASGRMIILCAQQEILLADDGQVTIDISSEAALQLVDNPTNASTSGTTATTMVSMFQTHSMALRATRWINWAKRRTTAVEYIKEAAYVA